MPSQHHSVLLSLQNRCSGPVICTQASLSLAWRGQPLHTRETPSGRASTLVRKINAIIRRSRSMMVRHQENGYNFSMCCLERTQPFAWVLLPVLSARQFLSVYGQNTDSSSCGTIIYGEKASQPGLQQGLGKNIPPTHGSGDTRHVNDSLVAENAVAQGPKAPKSPLRHLFIHSAVRI